MLISARYSYQADNSFPLETPEVRHMQLLLKTSYGKVAFQEISHLIFHQRYQIFRNITQGICTACQTAATEKEGKGIWIHLTLKRLRIVHFFNFQDALNTRQTNLFCKSWKQEASQAALPLIHTEPTHCMNLQSFHSRKVMGKLNLLQNYQF